MAVHRGYKDTRGCRGTREELDPLVHRGNRGYRGSCRSTIIL